MICFRWVYLFRKRAFYCKERYRAQVFRTIAYVALDNAKHPLHAFSHLRALQLMRHVLTDDPKLPRSYSVPIQSVSSAL